jgi:hypothetical protein
MRVTLALLSRTHGMLLSFSFELGLSHTSILYYQNILRHSIIWTLLTYDMQLVT